MITLHRRIVSMLLIVAFIAGCAQTPTGQVVKDDMIIIGVISPLSGPSTNYGVPAYHAMLLAQEEIVAQGGRLKLIFEDGKCDPVEASSAAHKLLEIDQVDALITGCSQETLVATPIAAQKNKILIGAYSTSPEIVNAGPLVYRTSPSDAKGMEALADLMLKKGHRTVGILTEQFAYTQGVRRAFEEAYVARGGKIIYSESFEAKQADFRTQILKAAEADALLFIPMSTESSIALATQVQQLGIDKQIYGNEIMGGALTIDGVGDIFEGLIYHMPAIDEKRPLTEKFLTTLEARYPEDNSPNHLYDATAYDAVHILYLVAEKCNADTACMQTKLNALSEYAGAAVDYTFDENGDPIFPFSIKQIREGKTEEYVG